MERSTLKFDHTLGSATTACGIDQVAIGKFIHTFTILKLSAKSSKISEDVELMEKSIGAWTEEEKRVAVFMLTRFVLDIG